MILGRMKETAAAYLNHGVTHAVLTVPSRELSQYIANSLIIKRSFRLQRCSTAGNKERRRNGRTQGPPSLE